MKIRGIERDKWGLNMVFHRRFRLGAEAFITRWDANIQIEFCFIAFNLWADWEDYE
jgi:hypothetical protein